MTVEEMLAQLSLMPPKAQVHVEVWDNRLEDYYGHAQSVSRSAPNVVVISNRNRVPQ